MQKKCKKIWSIKKKAVLLHPLFKNKHSAWFPRDVNQRRVCGPKSESMAIIHMSDIIANRIEP